MNDNPSDPANDMRIAFNNDISRCVAGSGNNIDNRCMCYRQVCPKYPICNEKVSECSCVPGTLKGGRFIDNTVDYVHANLYIVLLFVAIVIVAGILLSRKK